MVLSGTAQSELYISIGCSSGKKTPFRSPGKERGTYKFNRNGTKKKKME
jgi:hypothetical protein